MADLNAIDKYINKIHAKILANQNLCKLLKYNYDDPLAEPDLTDTSIIYTDKQDQRLFYTPYSDEIQSKTKSTLNVVVPIFEIDRDSKYFKNFTIDFVMMFSHEIWMIDDNSGLIKQRASAVLYELVNTFMDHRSAIGKDIFELATMVRTPNGRVSGYKLCLGAKDLPSL